MAPTGSHVQAGHGHRGGGKGPERTAGGHGAGGGPWREERAQALQGSVGGRQALVLQLQTFSWA